MACLHHLVEEQCRKTPDSIALQGHPLYFRIKDYTQL
jgi:hypothetical protein